MYDSTPDNQCYWFDFEGGYNTVYGEITQPAGLTEALYMYFADSETETRPEDEDILLSARLAVEELNRREGGGFLYLHRARKWDMGQRMYTGRERKRGALEALNRLLTEGDCADSFLYMSHSGNELLRIPGADASMTD